MDKLAGEERRAKVRGEEAESRLCAVTRVARTPDELIRFVADPEGRIVPDLARKLPGRGVWLTATRSTILQAVRQKAFARSLKTDVTAGAEIADLITDLMLRRVLDYLGLANKAGLAMSGFTQVERALERDRVYAILHAADGAPDGARKLDQKFEHVLNDKGIKPGEQSRRMVRFLTSAELSLAFGRSNVVHAALAAGGASRKFLKEAERLLHYRLV